MFSRLTLLPLRALVAIAAFPTHSALGATVASHYPTAVMVAQPALPMGARGTAMARSEMRAPHQVA